MPLKYLILVLLLMDFFHTFILSEKTRFGYPFVVPYLVFFVGVFCNAPFFDTLKAVWRFQKEPAHSLQAVKKGRIMRPFLIY